jgi:hypothetical protein
MSEIRKGTDAPGTKFDRLSEMVVSEMIKDYSQIKQAIRECEVRYEDLENKLRQGEEGQSKNNVIIFGLQAKREENYFETLDMVVKWLSKSMKARLGGRRGQNPILIKFT